MSHYYSLVRLPGPSKSRSTADKTYCTMSLCFKTPVKQRLYMRYLAAKVSLKSFIMIKYTVRRLNFTAYGPVKLFLCYNELGITVCIKL